MMQIIPIIIPKAKELSITFIARHFSSPNTNVIIIPFEYANISAVCFAFLSKFFNATIFESFFLNIHLQLLQHKFYLY